MSISGLQNVLPSAWCVESKYRVTYFGRKRYLGVSGGNRISFQNVVGGNEKILKGVLAAAEAAGVGQACPT